MISGRNALLRIYYATKYVTKMQEQVSSITVVAQDAFKRRHLREARNGDVNVEGPSTAGQQCAVIGRRRVASLLYSITNRREIAGLLAALYVLRGSCAYMSTACAPLPLRNVLHELVEKEVHSCDLIELQPHGLNEVIFRAASFLDDYLFRPLALDELSLYEFVANHFRRKRMPSTTDAALFLPTTQSSTRTASPTRTSFTCEIMANMDDYNRAAKHAEECEERSGAERVNNGSRSDGDDLTGTRQYVETALDRAATVIEPGATPTAAGADVIYSLFDADDDSDNDDSASAFAFASSLPIFPNAASYISSRNFQNLLGVTAETTAGSAAESHRRASTTFDFSLHELQRFINHTSNDEAESPSSEPFRNERTTEVIALLEDALENVCEWSTPLPPLPPHDSRPSSPPLRPYASIIEVSRAFTLNLRQHVAFTLITTSLLRCFLHQELGGLQDGGGYRTDNFERRFRDDQLLLFLGGAGGTGKSRVIDAVDAFCVSWHRGDAIVKTALTGKAATLIGGRTLARFLMRLKHTIKQKHFTPLDLLVIDEITMMSKPEWLRHDMVLRAYKQVRGVPFGGVHIVLVSDFLQMLPEKADPIYLDPTENTRQVSTADIEGFELWRKFTTVVILEESVRFRHDPECGEGCRLARLGQWTPVFIDMINSRVSAHQHGQQHDHLETPAQLERGERGATVGAGAVFVTPENATRLAVNNGFVAETAAMLASDVFPVRVLANFKGALNGLSRSDLQYVLGLPDNRFGRMAPYLDFINGMPVQITQNVATAIGVANGTLGSHESVHFPDGTTFRLVRDGATNTVVQLPSRPPVYVVLRVLHRPHATPIRPELDPELFLVLYATEAYQKMTITLPKAPSGRAYTVTVKPQQLSFVCAIGSTVFKVQGETLESMVVIDWKSEQRIVNKSQQTYLLVSRVTSRHTVVALTPFTNEIGAWLKPPATALNEEERLWRLSYVTLEKFQQSLPANEAATSIEPTDV